MLKSFLKQAEKHKNSEESHQFLTRAIARVLDQLNYQLEDIESNIPFKYQEELIHIYASLKNTRDNECLLHRWHVHLQLRGPTNAKLPLLRTWTQEASKSVAHLRAIVTSSSPPSPSCVAGLFSPLIRDINFELGQYYLQQDNVQLAQQYFTLLDPSVPKVAAFLSACQNLKHVKEFEGKLPPTLLVRALPDVDRSMRVEARKAL